MEKSPREKFDDTEKRERLLAEVEDILRTMPSQGDFTEDHDNAAPWIGRAAAAIQRWDVTYRMACQEAIRLLSSSTFVGSSCRALVRLLHQARADLRMEIGQQISMVIPSGNVFDYFVELRKVIEAARSEVFFVDAYLDAEFVPRYLPHVAKGVPIRLFGGPKKMATLLSSVDLFVKQSGTPITVRSSDKLHDRYL